MRLYEISDQALQDYLARAEKRVDSRMNRMAQARERLNKGYEIYHADRPAGSSQIVDRFEANTPQEARRYYERFIQNYESDVDFDLRLRRSTGIIESVQAYHGTFQPTLTKFNALSHFGTQQAAEDRLKEKARREKIRTPGHIYEVVLDIKNPFIAKDFAGVHSPTHFVFDLKNKGLISQEELSAINKHIGTPKQAELLIKKLRELGFDSIAYKNKYEDKGSTSYVILDPTQVVSVRPIKQEQTVTEAKIPNEIEDFLYDLMPDDVGVEEFGPYRVHYEGFTDDCKSSKDYRRNPEAVYQQVFADHIAREGGRKPVEQNFTGDEDYPILYSIFKIPRQVKEIARIPQSELGDWGEAGTLEPPKGAVKKKELPGGSGYTYAVNKTGQGTLEIMIFDGEKLAAELDLFETQDVLGTWGVETIVVERPYRGQGLGKALYGIALSILKLPIEAGQTQTKHGQAMWLMLNSIPGVEVQGYTMVPTAKYHPHKGDKIVKQDKEWTRYTFPVKPGIRSMRSGRPGTGLYNSQATMIARWTGQ